MSDLTKMIADAALEALSIDFREAWNWLSETAHSNARAKGFWDNRDKLQQLAEANELGDFARKVLDSNLRELTISEIGEACEGDRKNLMDDKIPEFTAVEAEMADCLIRIADYCGARQLRIGDAVIAKLKYNQGRERLHGKAL